MFHMTFRSGLLAATLIAASLAASAAGPRYGFNRGNTVGWTLMTAQERTDYQQKIRATKTLEECAVVQTEHHALMESRAHDKGMTLAPARINACDRMKALGLIK